MSCPGLYDMELPNGPKWRPHGNEFWVFSNSEMNGRNRDWNEDEKMWSFV